MITCPLKCGMKLRIHPKTSTDAPLFWGMNTYCHSTLFTPWPFRLKGYCRCLSLSAHPSVCPFVRKLYLVRSITRSQIWDGITKVAPHDTLGWKWGSLTLTFNDICAIFALENSACLCDISSPIWDGITKFAKYMHPLILSVSIENGNHWPPNVH